MKLTLIDIDKLKAHEKVLPRYLDTLRESIKRDACVKNPIIVDQDNYVVLDGSHRHIALLQLGCVKAPVLLVNYYSPHIDIGSHRKHQFRVSEDEAIPISKGAVLYTALTGKLMPPRSSRHYFKFNKLIPINVPLTELGHREPPDVSSHSADYSLQDEISDLDNYVTECNQSLEIINDVKQELVDIRDDLIVRLNKLKELKRDI